jgi:hypothetical protein
MGIVGANLGAFRQPCPQTVMDTHGHVYGDDRENSADRVHLIRQRSVVQVHLGPPSQDASDAKIP